MYIVLLHYQRYTQYYTAQTLCRHNYSVYFPGLLNTVNVDIFACINFREFMKIGYFAWTKFAFLLKIAQYGIM